MIEPRNTPCCQSKASVTSGTFVARRPPKRIAEIGTPAGSSHSGAIDGHCDAGAVKRALGWAAGASASGVQSLALPVDQVRGRLVGEALPPDVAVVGLGDVGEDAVGVERAHRVGVGLLAGAGGDAEEAGLGVDGVEPAVVAELHPGDVVADGLDLPARQRRDEHGHVRLAARRRERGGDVALLAVRGA